MGKIEVTGVNVPSIAVDEAFNICLDDSAKTIFVDNSGYQGIVTISNGAAVLVAAGTVFSVTKDNASTINVYVESNEVIIQNKTAAAISPNYKVI